MSGLFITGRSLCSVLSTRCTATTDGDWNNLEHTFRTLIRLLSRIFIPCVFLCIYLHITYYCFCLAVISLHQCFLLHYLFLGPEAWLNLISSMISRMLKTDLLGVRKKRKTTEVHAYSEGRLLWQMWMLCIGWDVGRWSTVATPKGNSW